MGALLLQQRNLWENSANPGVTSKSIKKKHNFQTVHNFRTKF